MHARCATIRRRRTKRNPATNNPALSVLRQALTTGSAVTSKAPDGRPPPIMSAPTRPTTTNVTMPMVVNAARSLMALLRPLLHRFVEERGMDDFTSLDATAQAALVRRREVKPIELVEAAIARIERINPRINAVVTPLFDTARASAGDTPPGPFCGVPFLVKDLQA